MGQPWGGVAGENLDASVLPFEEVIASNGPIRLGFFEVSGLFVVSSPSTFPVNAEDASGIGIHSTR